MASRKTLPLGLGAFAGTQRLDAFCVLADGLKESPAMPKLGVCCCGCTPKFGKKEFEDVFGRGPAG